MPNREYELCPYFNGGRCTSRNDVPTVCAGHSFYLTVPTQEGPVPCIGLIELVVEWHRAEEQGYIDFCLTSTNDYKREIVKNVIETLKERQTDGSISSRRPEER